MIKATARSALKRRFFDRVMLHTRFANDPRPGLVGQLGFHLKAVFAGVAVVNGDGRSAIHDLRLFMADIEMTDEAVARGRSLEERALAKHREFITRNAGQPRAIRGLNMCEEVDGSDRYWKSKGEASPDEPEPEI